MLRRFLVTAGAVVAVSASLAAGAAAGVQAAPVAAPAGAPALPFNTQAQIIAGNIVNADDSASAKADGLAVRATADKPLAKNYDASLLGMSITSSGLQVTVSGHESASLSKAISTQSDGMRVSIRVVPRSMTQLGAVQAKIAADKKFWASRGIDLTAWGPDLSSDTVRVMLADYSAAAAKKVIARYGREWVSVDPASVVVDPSDSRTDDAPPWYGGDEIIHRYSSSYVSICTSGFGLTILGLHMVPTAAHCLESNYSNDFYNPDGNEVGTIWSYDNAEDTVIVNAASVDGDIWSNPTSTSRTVAKVAPSDPTGGLICTDGLTNLEICSVKIESINQDVTYNINGVSTTVTGTVYACQTAGKAAFSGGDSGGPVETTLGSTSATARGEILANTDSAICGWYLPERTIESDWDASTVLG
jgi:hypothetical protein